MSEAPAVVAQQRSEATPADVAQELRSGDRFLLTTHEGPDGDALGSLLATHKLLQQLGKDSVMFLAAKEFPLPVEYRFLPLEEVFHEAPVDVVDRVLVFLDCGNIDRMPVDFLRRGDAKILNVDHHHDNTCFGTLNLVDTEASCTAEIVLRLAKLLGAEITPEIATALYVALVTDTGRFMYENTSPAAHRMAADLIEAGVDVHDIYRRLYERVPLAKLHLVARAVQRIELLDDCQLAVTHISDEDYSDTGSNEAMTEGIIDHVRALEGAEVAAMIRDKTDGGSHARKVSLRSATGRVDVSAIAQRYGGGGHTRAAGFSTDLTYDELLEILCTEVMDQLGST
jgi:bifunctional oligoribonuclease and PAP phosphatase NrnA